MSVPVLRPRPTSPPVYRGEVSKVFGSAARTWGLDDVLDAVFFIFSALAALWLSWVVLGSGLGLGPLIVVHAVVFWGLLSYLALPRAHQILTWLYVPDYFIGRTRTTDGLLGDPVNLAVRGSEEDLHEAMTAAGWVRADPITAATAWRIVISSLLRRSYPAAPVSPLVLFGRTQTIAYQKEVDGNPSQRHHVRFWHTPADWVLPGGVSVDWLAAATYDRAVGLSTFTFQVTHKIDADIDIERNYVVDDIMWANPAAHDVVLADFFTAYHSTNGGGDRVRTDGDLHVLDLTQVVPQETGSLELARARAGEAEARRQRPTQLLVALVLIVVNLVWRAVEGWVRGPEGVLSVTVAQASQLPALAWVADSQIAEVLADVLVVGSLAVGVVAVLLTVATWHGHPRGRIALMLMLAVKLTWDMARMSVVGLDGASYSLLMASGLGVLALLALSSRECHLWERSRKEERRQRRALRRQKERDSVRQH